MTVAVPDVIGLGRTDAEQVLEELFLRHIAHFVVETPFGAATAQTPSPGTLVDEYSVVTVTYNSPFAVPDSPVEGPTPPSGIYEGQISSVTVGNPSGTGAGAWVEFATTVAAGGLFSDPRPTPVTLPLVLYYDDPTQPPPLLAPSEWMMRGAMLGIAQRAFTNGTNVSIFVTADNFGNMLAQSLQINKS